MVLEDNKGGNMILLEWGSSTEYIAESAKLEGGNLILGGNSQGTPPSV